jgi:hypothetical protein
MVKNTMKNTDEPKQYSLNPTQSNLILFTQQHQQAIIAAIMSNIAYDMGYTVTENTQFELSNDYKVLKIHEIVPETVVKKAL